MDVNEVKDLMNQFDQSSLKEFDLKEGSFEIYMNKNNICRMIKDSSMQPETAATASEPVEVPASPAVEPHVLEPVSETVPAGVEIVSPIVGVVYLQSTPEEPAFKSIGDTVKKGDVVCIVEAMKVMNEIISDVEGTVSEILVDNEQVVEFGQPLFRVQ